MLHHMTLKSAVATYKDTDPGQLRAALEQDDRKWTPEEVDEIQAAIAEELLNPSTQGSDQPRKSKAADSNNVNQDLDLSEFDYNNLTGESFKKYLAKVNNMSGFEQRDFVQFMASGIFEKELDMKANEPRYIDVLVGIKINRPDPVNTTRVTVAIARELNLQIYNKDNKASNSRYYLLKK